MGDFHELDLPNLGVGYYSCNVWPLWFRLMDNAGRRIVWGYSVYEGEGGYRTLGIPWTEWLARHPNLKVAIDRDRTDDARAEAQWARTTEAMLGGGS